MDDYDDKNTLPVHHNLGANEYAEFRTNKILRVSKTGEPVTEHTQFGWALMSPGEDGVGTLGCFAVNSTTGRVAFLLDQRSQFLRDRSASVYQSCIRSGTVPVPAERSYSTTLRNA